MRGQTKPYRIFISGPVSEPMADHGWIWVDKDFKATEARLLRQWPEAELWNPVRLCHPSWSWLRCMVKCLCGLHGCDAVCLKRGYRRSRGSRTEFFFARLWRKDILLEAGEYVHRVGKLRVES